jgi:hypothetical protein
MNDGRPQLLVSIASTLVLIGFLRVPQVSVGIVILSHGDYGSRFAFPLHGAFVSWYHLCYMLRALTNCVLSGGWFSVFAPYIAVMVTYQCLLVVLLDRPTGLLCLSLFFLHNDLTIFTAASASPFALGCFGLRTKKKYVGFRFLLIKT